jgi:hypothetical protein
VITVTARQGPGPAGPGVGLSTPGPGPGPTVTNLKNLNSGLRPAIPQPEAQAGVQVADGRR